MLSNGPLDVDVFQELFSRTQRESSLFEVIFCAQHERLHVDAFFGKVVHKLGDVQLGEQLLESGLGAFDGFLDFVLFLLVTVGG